MAAVSNDPGKGEVKPPETSEKRKRLVTFQPSAISNSPSKPNALTRGRWPLVMSYRRGWLLPSSVSADWKKRECRLSELMSKPGTLE